VKNVSEYNTAFIDVVRVLVDLTTNTSSRETLYEVVVCIERRLKMYLTRLKVVNYELISIKQRMIVVYF
jgi:hypothetical protein